MTDTDHDAALNERVAAMLERSARLWAESIDKSVDGAGKKLRPDPLNAVPAMSKVMKDYFDQPHKKMEAATSYWTEQAELWARIAQRSMGMEVEPMIEPDRGDRRFKDEDWQANPYFDYLKQSYLLTARWLTHRLEEAEGLDPKERKIALSIKSFMRRSETGRLREYSDDTGATATRLARCLVRVNRITFSRSRFSRSSRRTRVFALPSMWRTVCLIRSTGVACGATSTRTGSDRKSCASLATSPSIVAEKRSV